MKRITLTWLFTMMIAYVSLSQTERISEAFNRSYAYEASKDYKSAIAALEAVYSQDLYEVQLRLGWLYYLVGNYFKSAEYYKKAISLKGKSIEARLGLAFPTYAMGNTEDLLKLYHDILQIDPANYTANLRSANLYYERKQFEQALPHAQKLIELYPFDYQSNLIAARIYVGMGMIVEAKKCYAVCLNFSPTDIEAIQALRKL
ncbi:MAG: tetratricopeptide repeat protein [Chitinophagales bacterium]|nr:tetratricopeptide repeat protein [Chitinophagales bacterium]MDW8419454.1 tetratricopeptide repeat protein [Chitinophagales bacterium]